MNALRVGIDVGGTFTDLVLEGADGLVTRAKVPSTPAAPTTAIIAGLRTLIANTPAADIGDVAALVHGTTVATNAVIQGGWARTGLITSQGFRDIIEIRRQTRPDVYDLRVPKPQAIVPRDLRLEVAERVRADGTVEMPLDEDAVLAAVQQLVAAGVQAVAVCFLHSYAYPLHERRAIEIISGHAPDLYVTASADVAAEFREYPRVSTTIVNAALGPVMRAYLRALTSETRDLGLVAEPRVMHSNGGIASPEATARLPVHTLVSGPTAGVIGAIDAAQRSTLTNLVTFDVGGTSTDVCLVERGKPVTSTEMEIAGYPLRGATVDVHSIGAGGGSVAWVDVGGFLRVGPHSAGARPGPACYSAGGTHATVTDANVVLGRLGDRLIGGTMQLDVPAAFEAIARNVGGPLGLSEVAAADAIIRVANANMARAIRLVSVERGHDPRQFTLVAFGGAGALHVAEVAREVGFETALIPGAPGLLSAYGLLAAPIRADFARTYPFNVSVGDLDAVDVVFGELEAEAARWLEREAPTEAGRVVRALDVRYVGQSFETTIVVPSGGMANARRDELVDDFYREYRRLYGSASDGPLEAVTLRVVASAAGGSSAAAGAIEQGSRSVGPQGERQVYFGEQGFGATPVYSRPDLGARGRLDGPLIIEQHDSTAVVPPWATIEWDESNNILLHVHSDGPRGPLLDV